jgi:hypothetical protein
VFSNAEHNLAEAMREAVVMPQPSIEEGRQVFQRIQELIATAVDRIPAPSDASITCSCVPRNSGARLPHRSNRPPHCILDTARVPSRNRAIMVADREAKAWRWGGGHSANGGDHEGNRANDDSIILMARATPVTMGEMQGINPN